MASEKIVAFDVTAALPEIMAEPELKKLGGRLLRLSYLYSCLADVAQSQEAVDRVVILDTRIRQSWINDNIYQADASLDYEGLFVLALNKYLRATSTGVESGRQNIFGMNWLTIPEGEAHERLKKLRNESIFHFGETDAGYERSFNQVKLGFVRRGDGANFEPIGISVRVLAGPVSDLQMLTAKVRTRLDTEIKEVIDYLLEVQRTGEDVSDRFLEILQKHGPNEYVRGARYIP
jgi:hypothetical protein